MVKVTGLTDLRARMQGLPASARPLVEAAVFAAADMIAADAANSITRGSISGDNHVPSAPGQPPNADSNLLDRGIMVAPSAKPDPMRPSRRVISQAPYSAALEYGTSKMAARPFMRPVIIENTPTALQLIKRAVAQAARGK